MHSFPPSDFEYCMHKKMQAAFMHDVTGNVSMYLFNLFVTCFHSIQIMLLSMYAAWFNPTQHMYPCRYNVTIICITIPISHPAAPAC